MADGNLPPVANAAGPPAGASVAALHVDLGQRLQALEASQQLFQQQMLAMLGNRQPPQGGVQRRPQAEARQVLPQPLQWQEEDTISILAPTDDFGLGDRDRDFEGEVEPDLATEERRALSNMRSLRAMIFDTLGEEVCPHPPESEFAGLKIRSGSFPNASAAAEQADIRRLDSLPLSTVVRDSFKFVDFTLRDQKGIERQDVSVKTVGLIPATVRGEAKAPRPGGRAMKSGVYFTREKPRIDSFRPKYYRTHEDSEFPLDAAVEEDADLARLHKAAQLRVKTKALQETEALMRSSLAVLNYQEWALQALSATLDVPDDETQRLSDNERRLFESVSRMVSHQAQLLSRAVANCVLMRRDGSLDGSKTPLAQELQLGLRVSPLTSCALFGLQIAGAMDDQGDRNLQGFKAPDSSKRKRSQSPLEKSDYNRPSASFQQPFRGGKKTSGSQRGGGSSARGKGPGKPKQSGSTGSQPSGSK